MAMMPTLMIQILREYYYNLSIRIWSPLLFKHSDLITVNTPYLFKQLIELGADPNRIELLPMGVDTSFFLPKENSHKKAKYPIVVCRKAGKMEKF